MTRLGLFVSLLALSLGAWAKGFQYHWQYLELGSEARSFAFSEDEKTVCIGDGVRRFLLLDTDTWTPIWSMRYSSNFPNVFPGSEKGTFWLPRSSGIYSFQRYSWSPDEIIPLKGIGTYIDTSSLRLSKDKSKLLVSNNSIGHMTWVDLASKRQVRTQGVPTEFRLIGASATLERLYGYLPASKAIGLVDIRTGGSLEVYGPPESGYRSVIHSEDQEILYALDENHDLWKVDCSDLSKRILMGRFSSTAQFGQTTSITNVIYLYNQQNLYRLENGKFSYIGRLPYSVSSLWSSPSGKVIIAVSGQASAWRVWVVDSKDGSFVQGLRPRNLPYPQYGDFAPSRLTSSGGGRILQYCVSGPPELRHFSLATGEQVGDATTLNQFISNTRFYSQYVPELDWHLTTVIPSQRTPAGADQTIQHGSTGAVIAKVRLNPQVPGALSADGRYLASFGTRVGESINSRSWLQIIDLSTGRVIQQAQIVPNAEDEWPLYVQRICWNSSSDTVFALKLSQGPTYESRASGISRLTLSGQFDEYYKSGLDYEIWDIETEQINRSIKVRSTSFSDGRPFTAIFRDSDFEILAGATYDIVPAEIPTQYFTASHEGLARYDTVLRKNVATYVDSTFAEYWSGGSARFFEDGRWVLAMTMNGDLGAFRNPLHGLGFTVQACLQLEGFLGDFSGIEPQFTVVNSSAISAELVHFISNTKTYSAEWEAVPRSFGSVFAKARTSLSRKIGRISPDRALSRLGSWTLVNGDVDGNDRIEKADADLVGAAMGTVAGDSEWDPRADLDGDAEVTIFDFLLVQQNLGRVGDLVTP